MNAPNQDVATRSSGATQKPQKGENATETSARAARDLPMLPPVDIFEDAYRLTVQAEMPGVSKDSLNVQVDRNNLLIEGEIGLDMPAGMSALYADVQTRKYRRSFTLSGELETEKISATLEDGLLTVRIPKRSEFQPRKIKVNVG
ncbi:MAG TPA: Hsp20/alpha crystallin family protein [Steroidobacteraceae bacterium]|nr:Hsp20/alpha crystallin family protein [Steroidobacteraceae bacterium]